MTSVLDQSWCWRLSGRSLVLLGLLLWSQEGSRASDQSSTGTSARRIVILGDSITAGYGLENPATQAYPALLRRKIKEAGWAYDVVNAGISGDTTAGGLRRVQWAMKGGADVLVVALGGNDGLRGVDPQTTASNLSGIIRAARERQPDISILLAGMKMPDSMGAVFSRSYGDVFPAVASREKVFLIPYFLQGVGGMALLNQQDRIHPTAEGQGLIAETVWQTLKPVLEARHKTAP